MAVKFLFDQEYGLQVKADEDNEELTEQQAMIVAVRDLASGMGSLSQALWEIQQEFDVKRFYDDSAADRIAQAITGKKPPAEKLKSPSKKKRR